MPASGVGRVVPQGLDGGGVAGVEAVAEQEAREVFAGLGVCGWVDEGGAEGVEVAIVRAIGEGAVLDGGPGAVEEGVEVGGGEGHGYVGVTT